MVIGILAAISIVAYNGISRNARTASIQSTITQLQKKIELYKAENGEYPATTTVSPLIGGNGRAWADSNCSAVTSSSERRTDWIPGLDITLPQSDGSITGAQGHRGCYLYVSNGTEYVLSAWNMLPGPTIVTGYRRLGFRETVQSYQQYYCNHLAMGGQAGGYAATKDYYKYSYTVSNVTSCNETPPAGA